MKKATIFIILVLASKGVFSQNPVFNSIRNTKSIAHFKVTKKAVTVDTLNTKKPIIEPKKKSEKISPGNFFLPVKKYKITSDYGYRFHPIDKRNKFHYGIDLKTNKSKIYAVLNGTIIKAEYDKHLGYYIKIKHNKICTIYGHLSKINVKVGERVKAGDIIGISGKTGKATGDHLHFAVKYGNKYLNPRKLLTQLIF
ncbi:MAG: M23 family metallopeptidase [Flavobacteriales bacterium]|jgi:murein DD-endopeptidase MepM/ murein hydrolase activator NlpD